MTAGPSEAPGGRRPGLAERMGWMFPGQGSQRPGMAGGLVECKELFDTAREILDVDLARICTVTPNSGPTGVWPPDLLQPALYATCTGASRSLSYRGACPDAVVGHSLGEYAALTAAGSLAYEDGLRLVSMRGKAMLAAARRNPGGMAAVIGLARHEIAEICGAIDEVWVANLNSPNQTVISGRDEPLAQAAEACRQAGAKRVVRLEVPIPGHCPLMETAALEVEGLLAGIQVKEPVCPFYSSVDSAPHTDPAEIKRVLVAAMTSPVRFYDTLEAMQSAGVASLVEVGPGRVLCGLAKRSVPDMPTTSVGSDAEAETFALTPPASERAGTWRSTTEK
ncbi:MAG TPA: ACP S-malonyltransferase [Actinomycetota bacterium]|nr:ACP S-malonyltransferase [Actinomycetota bacterium]